MLYRIVILILIFRFASCGKSGYNLTEEEQDVLKTWKGLEKTISKFIDNGIKSALPYGMQLISEIEISPQCQSSLLKWIFGLRKLRTWAFDFLDATGKPVPGMLYGTLAFYGNFEQCMNILVRDERNGKEQFRGQYCSLDIKLKLPPKPDVIVIQKALPMFKDFVEEKDTVVRLFARYAQLLYGFPFRLDLCLPSKCTMKDISTVIQLAEQNIDIAKIDLTWCNVKEDVELDTTHLICSSAIAIMAILMLIGTAWDYLRNWELLKMYFCGIEGKYLCAFSMRKTFSRLIEKVPDSQIASFHGVRFISSVILIAISTLFSLNFQMFSGLFNLFTLPEYTTSEALLHGTIYVNTFFLLSGTMVVYSNMSGDEKKEGKFNVISYIARRLFRIIPSYLFLMACIIVLPNSASGPSWNPITKPHAQNCRDNWWKNLLFINNFFVRTENECLHNSWYVALDFQMYCIAIIFLALLIVWRSKKWAAFTAVALSVAGMISVGIMTYLYDYPATILIANLDHSKINNYKDIIYHLPHDHIASYCVGLGLGYLFVKKPKYKIPMTWQIVGWTMSTLLWSSILFGIDPWNKGNLPTSLLASIFAATHRFSWSIAVGWIIAACFYGYGGIINTILANRFFVFMSRLTFMAFVGYSVTYNVVFGYYRMHVYISRIELVFFLVMYLLTVYFIACIFYMMVDGPVIELKKLIFYHPLSNRRRTSITEKELKHIQVKHNYEKQHKANDVECFSSSHLN